MYPTRERERERERLIFIAYASTFIIKRRKMNSTPPVLPVSLLLPLCLFLLSFSVTFLAGTSVSYDDEKDTCTQHTHTCNVNDSTVKAAYSFLLVTSLFPPPDTQEDSLPSKVLTL